jgi:hypothetical protein
VIIFLEPVDDARDAVSDEGHLEVDEQAQALVGKPEIDQKCFLWTELTVGSPRGGRGDRVHTPKRWINRFQQTWAKRRMNAESGVDNLRNNSVLGH